MAGASGLIHRIHDQMPADLIGVLGQPAGALAGIIVVHPARHHKGGQNGVGLGRGMDAVIIAPVGRAGVQKQSLADAIGPNFAEPVGGGVGVQVKQQILHIDVEHIGAELCADGGVHAAQSQIELGGGLVELRIERRRRFNGGPDGRHAEEYEASGPGAREGGQGLLDVGDA